MGQAKLNERERLDMQNSDWRSETRNQLAESTIYQELKSRCENDAAAAAVVSVVDEAVYEAYQRCKSIIRHMPQYTLHDGDHLFRVLRLMACLIPDVEQLETAELMLLILAAFYHDIGMAPNEAEVLEWLEVWNSASDEDKSASRQRFRRWLATQEHYTKQIDWLDNQGRRIDAQTLRQHLVSEYIRKTHAARAREIIQEMLLDKVKFEDSDLTVVLADTCASHNDEPLSLLAYDSSYPVGQNRYINIPFVCVVLRLADLLDFDAKRTPKILFSHLAIRHPVSLTEWQKHRSVSSWSILPEKILFKAECSHPAIESAIGQFCDIIDRELLACSHVLGQMRDSIRGNCPDHYRLRLPATVDRSRVGASRKIDGKPCYQFINCTFTLEKRQIMQLLMGDRLYRDRSVALRELLQNAIDACVVRQALEDTWGRGYAATLSVTFAQVEGEDRLVIEDNGIGMDVKTIREHYSRVGASFYHSPAFSELRAKYGVNPPTIARFGIGVLANFMVADSFYVRTRRLVDEYSVSDAIDVRVESPDSVFWLSESDHSKPGTRVELVLRSDHPWKDMNDQQRIAEVEKLVLNPPFPISVTSHGTEKLHTDEQFNAVPPEDWAARNHPQIKRHVIKLDSELMGFRGWIELAVLVDEHGIATHRVQLPSTSVSGSDQVRYDLHSHLQISDGTIDFVSDSLRLQNDGSLRTAKQSSWVLRSDGKLSVCGIAIPATVFPLNFEVRQDEAHFVLPFVCRLKIDVSAKAPLDLDAARSAVIDNEKWKELQIRLINRIVEALRESHSKSIVEGILAAWKTHPVSNCEHVTEALRRAAVVD